jgi:hypothetical protein
MLHMQIKSLCSISSIGQNVGVDVPLFPVFCLKMTFLDLLTQQVAAEETNIEDDLKKIGLSGVSLDTVLCKPNSTQTAYLYNVQKYLSWYEGKKGTLY